MSYLKSKSDLALMRPACQLAATVLEEIGYFLKPGLTTCDVDNFASNRIQASGGRSAFLGYRKFPGNVCVSVNDEVVHGIGSGRMLLFGDIVSVDCGVFLNGFAGDTARTFIIGGCDPAAQRLIDVTEQALAAGILQAVAGNHVVDISRAIQKCVESNGFSVVREFVGHGVGRSIHEPPQVPNFVHGGRSEKLKSGMTLAIEPMVNAGGPQVRILKDGWTVLTCDGSLSAHFEHTVLITEGAPEIMTIPNTVPVGTWDAKN